MTNDTHRAATGLQGPFASQGDAIEQLLKGTAIVAGFTHIAFLGIFYWFGLDALVFVNALSIFC